jgi:hypothetical protein
MLKQVIFGAAVAMGALTLSQTSIAQPGAPANPHAYQYRDQNGQVHWDRAGWRRAEEIRKQREFVRTRELQRQHQAEQLRERQERQRMHSH